MVKNREYMVKEDFFPLKMDVRGWHVSAGGGTCVGEVGSSR